MLGALVEEKLEFDGPRLRSTRFELSGGLFFWIELGLELGVLLLAGVSSEVPSAVSDKRELLPSTC